MKTFFIAAIGGALLTMMAHTSTVAMPVQGMSAGSMEDATLIRWRRNHRCTTERIVRRGHNGRRIVTTRRICR